MKTVQTSYWELHCRMQDGAGDGTVPVSSGRAPIRQVRQGSVRQQVQSPGFDHEASYANPLTQQFTLYPDQDRGESQEASMRRLTVFYMPAA